MRLLLFNPNTNAALTDQLAGVVQGRLGAGDELEAVTAATGPAFIGSEETIRAARTNLAAELPALARLHDAVLLGCFGDLAIAEARRQLEIPVISLWDACVQAARADEGKIGIVTTSRFWAEQLWRDAAKARIDAAIGAIYPVATASASIDQDAVAVAVRSLQGQAGIERIVFGGALLSAQPAIIPKTLLPVVDLIGMAIALCRRPDDALVVDRQGDKGQQRASLCSRSK